MATNVPATPFLLSKSSQEGLLEFHKQAVQLQGSTWNIRSVLEQADKEYMREVDATQEGMKARIANTYGDVTKFQNITVPVVKPLVEAAVTYQTSVFLTGQPIFGVVADPAYIDEALQFQTILENQAFRGGWVSELINHFRNGFKYNLAALEVDWRREKVPTLSTDVTFSTRMAKPTETVWEGNTLRNLDLYNTVFDLRVPPTEVHKIGEFAGYTKLYSRIGLKKLVAELPDKIVSNLRAAFESQVGAVTFGDSSGTFYIPKLNPRALTEDGGRGEFNWLAWGGEKNTDGIQYKNAYEVTTLYVRILPKDFSIKVPQDSTPQVWKLLIVNHQVLIYAERLTNAHGWIPILFSQPYEDGLSYQTKSLLQDVAPMQYLSSALANSWIASRRRAIGDRCLYDPSRVSSEHINSANPSAKIPVRPSAYGKPVGEAVFQFPFRDDQIGTIMSEMQQVQQFAYAVSGQNQAKQGQFVKGNKTLHEYSDVMNHSNGNDQKTAMLLEAQLFTPLKEILRLNILQYQGAEVLLSEEKKKAVTVDPLALRKAVLKFKVSDGLIPADKLLSGESWTTAMQVIGSNPQVGGAYNFAQMFSYLMKTQGADLSPFEKSKEQLAYEQALASWQQVYVEGMKQGIPPEKLPPQPMPQNYGYDPAAQSTQAATSQQTTSTAAGTQNAQA